MNLFQIYKAAEKAMSDAHAKGGVNTKEITLECDEKRMSVSNISSINESRPKNNSDLTDYLSIIMVLYVILIVASLIAAKYWSWYTEDFSNIDQNPGVFMALLYLILILPLWFLGLLFWIIRYLSIPFAILLEVSTYGLIGSIYRKKKDQKKTTALLQKWLSASEVLPRELSHCIEMYSQEAKRLEKEDEKEWNRIIDEGFPSNVWFLRLGENNVCLPYLDDSRFFYDERSNRRVNTIANITYLRVPEGIRDYEIHRIGICIKTDCMDEFTNMKNLRTLILPCSVQEIFLGYHLLDHLEIPSSVSSIDGVPEKTLQTLTVVLNKGNDEEYVMEALKDVVTETTTVLLKWDNFLWDPDEDHREDLFIWKEELLNLDSQIQIGNGVQPFHISGDHLFRANKFKISFIEG